MSIIFQGSQYSSVFMRIILICFPSWLISLASGSDKKTCPICPVREDDFDAITLRYAPRETVIGKETFEKAQLASSAVERAEMCKIAGILPVRVSRKACIVV